MYLGIKGAFALFFMLSATVASVYRIEEVGLDPLRLVLLGTALEVAVLVFEVPTGVFADTYGRRRSVVAGFLLMRSGFVLEGAVPVFWAVLAAQAVWGGGARVHQRGFGGLIADEAPERDLGHAYLRGQQADYLGSLMGVFGSVALATVALNLPLLLGGVLTVGLGATLSFVMPERRFRPSPREGGSSLHHAGATARGGLRLVRARPVLLLLLAVAVFSGMSEEGFDRLYAKHFLDGLGLSALGALDPVVWFGVINAGTLVGMFAFALSGSLAFALAAFWFTSLTRTLAEPLYLAWLNEGLKPRVRAALGFAALVLSPTLLLYARAFRGRGRPTTNPVK